MSRALDTNIVVRALAEPQSPQYQAARAAFVQPFLLPPSVVMESAWVLRSVFAWPRARIAEAFFALLDLPECHGAREQLAWAVDRFANGADLADMIHLMLAGDAESFATFDRDLGRGAGSDAPLPVEVLR